MEFQLSYFKSWKMMLWKCYTQYASKFGKLSSGHRTGKGQFSFQSQRKAMPKNAQTTTQLHSSHTLAKWWSKYLKPGFSNTWTVNFQMFKLVLEMAKEPEIKLPSSAGYWKSKRVPEKPLLLFDYAKAFDCLDHNKLWKILQEMGISDHLTCLLRNLYEGQEATEPNMEQQTGSKLWKECIKAVYCHPVYLTYMQNTSCEMVGWINHKLEPRLLGEISITSDMQTTPPLWQKVKN